MSVQDELRLKRLREVLRHAEGSCPGYRRLFHEAGVTADGFRSIDELSRIPPVTRRELQLNLGEYLSTAVDPRDRVRKSTSGSSGEPLIFYRDRETTTAGKAGTMRCMALAGWKPGDAVGYVWGFESDVETVFHDLKGIVSREFQLNAFRQGDRNMARWAARIRRHRIRFLYGYPNAIEVFAHFLEKAGEQLPMTAVFCTAEHYLPQQRAHVERVFGCKSYNLYGSSEVQSVAYECREGRLHLASDFAIAQSIGGDASGEVPRLVLTSLWNRCLPFIRYEIGDHGRVLKEQCPCGIPGELLQLIGGKNYDFLRTREGYLHGAVAGRAFCNVAGVTRYQLIQHGFDEFTARAVLPETRRRQDVRRQLERSVLRVLERHFGEGTHIHFEYPRELSPAPSGKFRFVIQEME